MSLISDMQTTKYEGSDGEVRIVKPAMQKTVCEQLKGNVVIFSGTTIPYSES